MADRTRTSIANMAADFMDVDPIGNIADQYGDALIYNRNYQEAVETVISEFEWNVVKTRAQLNSATLPFDLDETDFQYAYTLPSDCLVIIDINGRPIDDVRYAVESVAQYDAHGTPYNRRRVFLTDTESPVIMRYHSFIEPSDMSAHLAKACALELAMRCITKFRNSTTSMEQLRDLYSEATKGNTKRKGGMQVDAKQNRPKPRRVLPSPRMKARYGEGL